MFGLFGGNRRDDSDKFTEAFDNLSAYLDEREAEKEREREEEERERMRERARERRNRR